MLSIDADEAVKGLYDSIRELQKGAESLKAENGGLKGRNDALQAELQKLLSENRQLKRKRSTSTKSSLSKASKSGNLSCLQSQDQGGSCDSKDSTYQHSEKSEASCTSPAPDLESKLDSATERTIEQHEDTQRKLELAMEQDLRTMWVEYGDETQTVLLPSESHVAFQSLEFPAFDSSPNFLVNRPSSSALSEQFSPADTQQLSDVNSSRPSFSDEIPSSQFETFVNQSNSCISLPVQPTNLDELSQTHVDFNLRLGFASQYPNALHIGKRRPSHTS